MGWKSDFHQAADESLNIKFWVSWLIVCPFSAFLVVSFTMAGGKSQGMPGPVKAVLSKFGGGKEEDRMVRHMYPHSPLPWNILSDVNSEDRMV